MTSSRACTATKDKFSRLFFLASITKRSHLEIDVNIDRRQQATGDATSRFMPCSALMIRLSLSHNMRTVSSTWCLVRSVEDRGGARQFDLGRTRRQTHNQQDIQSVNASVMLSLTPELTRMFSAHQYNNT